MISIYFQITTRCNMRCAHCGFACTNRGRDMDESVFRRALAFCVRNRYMMTLGGGEPTIHPKFWDWMQYARRRLAPLREYEFDGYPGVGLVTNGSNTELSLKLAAMAEQGKVWAAVSKDAYHDPIDPRVYIAFKKPHRDPYGIDLFRLPHEVRIAEERRRRMDLRDIRTVGVIRASGRAKSWGDDRWGNFCCGLHLDPDGKLWESLCRKVLICDFAKSAGRNRTAYTTP